MATTTDVEGIVVLSAVIEQEDDQFVSYCRELGTSSCGDTIEEAFANLEEAMDVHLNALEETHERDRFFRERNINIIMAPLDSLNELTLTVPLGKPFKTFEYPVRVPALT